MPQSPRISLATPRWTGGEQNSKRISMKWLSWLAVRQWQHYTMLMLFVFVFEVSVGYGCVVNFAEVADAMCSIANLCIIVVGDPDQKWHEVTSLMLLLGRNQLKLPYLGSQQIRLVLPRHKWGEDRIRKMKIRLFTAWSVGQEYLLKENTSNENSRGLFLLVVANPYV